MVQVSDKTPIDENGNINVAIWLQALKRRYPDNLFEKLTKHVELAKQLGLDTPAEFAENAYDAGLKMAAILSELNADVDALCAALIYESVQQGAITQEKLLPKSTKTIVSIVNGAINLKVATALSGLKNDDFAQVDRLRKMLLTMVNDARIVLVKLADRVLAMRNSKDMPDEKRIPLAASISHIYAPLANRLGIGQIKWELEDRAFFALHRDEYKDITSNLDERRLDREAYIKDLITELKDSLAAINVDADVQGRVKHIYSIYLKMQKKDLDFKNLFDIRAMRILVKDVRSCYEALALIHEKYEPILSEFTDYIATPKSNGYRSIHTVVKGPEGKTVEIQIRTFGMHEESEMGVAAHWRYKEGVGHDAGYESRINWLRSLLDWQQELSEEDKALKDLNHKIADERVYVFTPAGDVIDLPTGSTPIDFAYHVHSDVGHRCRGAKVNGRLVQLNYALSTGERIEIVTGKESKPSRDWLREELGFIKSPGSRQKIGLWFRQQLREDLNQKTEAPQPRVRVKPVEQETQFPVLKRSLPQKSKDDLVIGGQDNLLFKMAGCCKPVIGDEVVGYITQGKGVSVHRVDCDSIARLKDNQHDRLVNVEWSKNAKTNYPVDLVVQAQDRSGLLKDLMANLAGADIKLLGIRTHVNRKTDSVTINMTIEVNDTKEISKVINLIRQMNDVISVARF